jgi:hypothetical protein
MTIFSRIKPEWIDKNLFDKFSENNSGVAWEYAFSQETSRKNNVEFDFGSVEYDIQNDFISIEDMLYSDSEIVTCRIIYPYDFNLRISSVIRRYLRLSANKLNILLEANVFSIQEKSLQKKQKVKNEDVVHVNREKLRNIYHLWFPQYT